MTASIDTSKGRPAMAYVAGTAPPWWQSDDMQATAVPADADRETWRHASGLDYAIRTAIAHYRDDSGEWRPMTDRQIHYRSDTGAPLAVASTRYQLVQPEEIVDFFHSVSVETMGALQGGAVYWALARLGEFDVRVPGRSADQHVHYGLVSTSCDGTLATDVRQTDVRVVCSNTLTAARSGARRSSYRQKHSGAFDRARALASLQQATRTAGADMSAMRDTLAALAAYPVSDAQAAAWFAQLLRPPTERSERPVAPSLQASTLSDLLAAPASVASAGGHVAVTDRDEAVTERAIRGHAAIVDAYYTAPGAVPGSAYGLVQGASYYIDHVRGTDGATRTQSALFGQGAALKGAALAQLHATVRGERPLVLPVDADGYLR